MDENVQPKKKNSWVYIVVIIVVVLLAAAGYYFLIRKAANPIVWDGTYRITGSMACTGNVPKMPSTIPVNEDLSVVNNAVVDTAGNFGTAGKTYPIDSQAKVSLILNQSSDNQGVTQTATGQMDFEFYKEGDALKARGHYSTDITIVKGAENYSANCVGDVSGAKL